jgi:hypothetical protein
VEHAAVGKQVRDGGLNVGDDFDSDSCDRARVVVAHGPWKDSSDTFVCLYAAFEA